MTDAPQCPEGCGPFGLPGHPEYQSRKNWVGWVNCAACGFLWESAEEYAIAVRAQDEYLALERIEDAQTHEQKRAANDRRALADWEAWAVQHG